MSFINFIYTIDSNLDEASLNMIDIYSKAVRNNLPLPDINFSNDPNNIWFEAFNDYGDYFMLFTITNIELNRFQYQFRMSYENIPDIRDNKNIKNYLDTFLETYSIHSQDHNIELNDEFSIYIPFLKSTILQNIVDCIDMEG